MSFSETEQTTISPHNQQPVPGTRRVYPSKSQLETYIAHASIAQSKWKTLSVDNRIDIVNKFIIELEKMESVLAQELTMQMGRPISQTPGEIKGTIARARYMASIAKGCLADVSLRDTDQPGFTRFIRKEPLGVILVVAPWNYPFLTTINSVLPALIAGNAVLLKPSPQTPLVAERFQEMFQHAGLPPDLLIPLHLSPSLTRFVASHPYVNYVSFTGSVEGGKDVERATVMGEGIGSKRVVLELGGKDPAYVRSDADLEYSITEIVDGAFFNSGQSCCAVERVYVHESLYDAFVQGVIKLVQAFKLGDPLDLTNNLGPVVSAQSASRIRKQIEDAVEKGAKKCIDDASFPVAKNGTSYVAPEVLVDVNHNMKIMTEETFGPVVGIMKVSSDDEALRLMNESRYGLTASIWTKSDPASSPEVQRLMDELECGTVFLNRCDYLDPALAWGGVKDSGKGVSLSSFGYDQLVRLKSIHIRHPGKY